MERASIFEAFWVLMVVETREMTFVQHRGVVWYDYKISKIFIFSSRLFFPSAERFSSKFASSNLHLPHIPVLKEILYKSS